MQIKEETLLIVLFLLLWIGGIILLFADSKRDSTKWASAIAFFGGAGGLSIVIEDSIAPDVSRVAHNELLLSFIELTINLFSFISHYFTPYAFLMFSISYSGLILPIWKKKLSWILCIPILFMAIYYPIYPKYIVPYRIASLWVAPYILIGVFLLMYAYIKEDNLFLKQNRFFTNLVYIPPILFGLITNFILRGIGIDDIWRYNPLIVFLSFIIFIIAIFRYGFLEIKITVQGYHLQRTMQTLFSGTVMLNHKLKNDLGKINLFCEKINQYADQFHHPELKQDIQIIKNSANHLQELVSNFQSRTADTPLIKNLNNVKEIIENCILSLSPSLQNIQINRNYYTDIELFCDEKQMNEVFYNILLNAVEAMPNGGMISIHFQENFSHYMIQISDTGSGIQKETLPHIFEPFFTTKSESKKNYGLGLSYCYNVIHKHGGSIKVNSTLGKGTTFYIQFPKYKLSLQKWVKRHGQNTSVTS
jgi:two-component system, sporulation sensor kinase B